MATFYVPDADDDIYDEDDDSSRFDLVRLASSRLVASSSSSRSSRSSLFGSSESTLQTPPTIEWLRLLFKLDLQSIQSALNYPSYQCPIR